MPPRRSNSNQGTSYSLSLRERAGVRGRASAVTTDAGAYPASNPGARVFGHDPLTPTLSRREREQNRASARRSLRLAPLQP